MGLGGGGRGKEVGGAEEEADFDSKVRWREGRSSPPLSIQYRAMVLHGLTDSIVAISELERPSSKEGATMKEDAAVEGVGEEGVRSFWGTLV